MGGKNSKGTLKEILRQSRMQPTANTGFSQKPALDLANCQPSTASTWYG